MRIKPLSVVLAVATSVACGENAPLPAQPTASSPLAISVSSRVLGLGFEGPYGAGVTLSVVAFAPATASAWLEVGFAGDPTPLILSVPFSPATLSLPGAGSGTLSASVPDASDPRLGGRKPTSLRAALTVRDHAGTQQTIFLNLSVTQN